MPLENKSSHKQNECASLIFLIPNYQTTMKVKELIEKLQKLDPEKMVVTSGYEGGYDEISETKEIRLKLNANTAWYYGKHEQDDEGECHAVSIG